MAMNKEYGRAVLIVDNDKSIRQNLAVWVEMTCCDVVEAENGQKALLLAREKSPKLILMDMDLPGKAGFEAAERISSQEETKQIPIVAMATPGGEFNWREKARRRGCVECVSKPLDYETISDLVDRYIPND